jgi:hypothetical protein
METIEDLHRLGFPVTASCPACQRTEAVSLDAVAAKKGWDWSYVRQRWPLRCTTCGARHLQIHIGIGSAP